MYLLVSRDAELLCGMLKEDYLGQVRSAAVLMGEAKHGGAVLGVSRSYHIVSKRLRLHRFPTGAALVVEAELRDYLSLGESVCRGFLQHSWRGTGRLVRAHL